MTGATETSREESNYRLIQIIEHNSEYFGTLICSESCKIIGKLLNYNEFIVAEPKISSWAFVYRGWMTFRQRLSMFHVIILMEKTPKTDVHQGLLTKYARVSQKIGWYEALLLTVFKKK